MIAAIGSIAIIGFLLVAIALVEISLVLRRLKKFERQDAIHTECVSAVARDAEQFIRENAQ